MTSAGITIALATAHGLDIERAARAPRSDRSDRPSRSRGIGVLFNDVLARRRAAVPAAQH